MEPLTLLSSLISLLTVAPLSTVLVILIVCGYRHLRDRRFAWRIEHGHAQKITLSKEGYTLVRALPYERKATEPEDSEAPPKEAKHVRLDVQRGPE